MMTNTIGKRTMRWTLWLPLAAAALGLVGCGSGGTDFGGSVDISAIGVRDVTVDVTDTQATISWVAKRLTATGLKYSTTNALELSSSGTRVSGEPDTAQGVTFRAVLTGLKPDTGYYFQAGGRKTTLRFRTLGGKRQRIAFVSGRQDGRREVYLAYERGENVTRASTTGGWSPALSLDGKQLAWVGAVAGGGTDVFLAQLDTAGVVAGSVHNLTQTAGRDEAHPAFTADGTAVTFAADGKIITRTIAGGAETTLLGGLFMYDDPSWKRDGSRLAFVSNRRTATVQLSKRPVEAGSVSIKVDDKPNTPLPDTLWELYDPATGMLDLSNAGVGNLRVLVTYKAGGETITDERIKVPVSTTAVYSSAPDGSDVRRLTSVENACYGPTWSADGGQVLFSREGDNRINLASINADGAALRGLTNGTYIDRAAAVAPDGSGVLFSTNRDADHLVNLWLLVAGTDPVPVTLYSSGETEPAWSVVP